MRRHRVRADLVGERAQVGVFVQLRAQQVAEPQGDVGVFGRVAGDPLQLDLVHCDLLLALAEQIDGRHLAKLEQLHRQVMR